MREVTRTYPMGQTTVTALDAVSLDCAAGTWTAVMGPSGSGKSTLLACAAGLDRPEAGQVVLGGRDIAALSDDTLTRLRRTDIGFVFQHFNLVAALTAVQNVALPLHLAGQRGAEGAAAAALRDLGLGEYLGHKPRQLSGGQQQRVAIARALATRPELLFADEPTGALDSSSAGVVLDLLRTLVDDRGQTVLTVTHDPAAAARADRVVFLQDGHVVTTTTGGDAPGIAATLAHLEDAKVAIGRVGSDPSGQGTHGRARA